MEKAATTELALEKKSAAVESASAAKAGDESSEETLKSFETKVSEALDARKTLEVYGLMLNASEADLKAVATNSTLMTSLMGALSGHMLNDSLDKLYDHVTKIDVIEECILRRFNVNMGAKSELALIFKDWWLYEDVTDTNGDVVKDADGNAVRRDIEKRWTVVGAKRVYKCLKLLPGSHVAMVNDITTTNTTNGGGGFAYGPHGVFNVDYNSRNPDGNSAGFCESASDYKHDLPAFDATIVHELGHIVDTNQKYSKRSDFRKISDWKDEGKDSAKLVKTIEKNAETPYAADLTNEEKDIARKGAQRLIDNNITDNEEMEAEIGKQVEEQMADVVGDVYDDLKKNDDGKDPSKGNFIQRGWNSIAGKGYRSLDDLTKVLTNSKVYTHIIRSSATSQTLPCYGGLQAGMKRQMHQGYENGVWYSYANEAYAQKISMYQFRDPGEEFAELYSNYHVAQPKGSKTSDAHKAWFHKMNLHMDDPGKKK